MENKHNFSNSQNLKFKVKVKVVVAQSCSTLYHTMFCSPPGSSCPWDSPGKNFGGDSHFFSPEYLPDPGVKSGSPTLQADSLPSEPPG